MFILNKLKEKCSNYPKYLILLKNISNYRFSNDNVFYYIVSSNKRYMDIPDKIPNYLIILDLYFDRYNKSGEKFNLFKLGTDYLVNNICMHYQNECIGSYPDNYVFVNEPRWPKRKNLTDRAPLKRSYIR